MNQQDPIRRTALNWLARRDYSQQEITQKLKAKGHAYADIEAIVNDLSQAGFINDLRFAENYLHWRSKKGYGPLRINMELRTRGIPDSLIAQLHKITDNAWFTAVADVWQKRFKGQSPVTLKEKAKQMRFLQHRGFTQEQIDSVLNNDAHEKITSFS